MKRIVSAAATNGPSYFTHLWLRLPARTRDLCQFQGLTLPFPLYLRLLLPILRISAVTVGS